MTVISAWMSQGVLRFAPAWVPSPCNWYRVDGEVTSRHELDERGVGEAACYVREGTTLQRVGGSS